MGAKERAEALYHAHEAKWGRCAECGSTHEGIGGYYDAVRCRQKAARRAWEQSAEYPTRGKMWEKYIDAGNCGD